MKNTKKVVALALALTVGSQAGMSFADEIKDSLIVEKEIVTQEEQVVQEETEQATKGEQAVEEEQEQVTEKEIVEEVYAQDLAGNESKVGSKVVSVGNVNEVVEEAVVVTDENPSKCSVGEEKSVERALDFKYVGFGWETSKTYNEGDKLVINPEVVFDAKFNFEDVTNSFNELDFIINTDPTNPNNGLLVRGVASADGNLSTTSLSNISVESVEFSNNGWGTSRATMKVNFNGCTNGSSYRIWFKEQNGNYRLVEYEIVMDTKAPVAKKDPFVLISKNGLLTVRQDSLDDEGSFLNTDRVYALVKDRQGNLVETIWLEGVQNNPDVWEIPTVFEGSLDLKALGYDRGWFTVEIEAQDILGNKTIVSSKAIQFNMDIDSEEFLSATGFTAEENGVKWLVNGSELKLNALSKSKDDAYNNVYFKVYDGETNNENKILAIVGLNSAGQLECTNVGESYFDLVSSKYSTSASDDSNYTYDNKGEVVLKLKDGAYNKTLSVEAYFTTDDGRESRIPNMFGQLKTDYVAPKATITSESNHFVIRAKDYESGIKSMVVYDANGLVITDSATDGMISVSEYLNPSTVTITDIAGNISVYDVKNGGIVDGAGTPEVTPPADDDYVDGDGNDGDNGNGGVENKPEQKPDVPNVPSTPDQTPDVPSTPDNGGNNGEQNPSTPDDKPSVPVNPSEPEEGNKPSNPDNGEINKPVDTDKPNGDGDNKPNDEIIVTPDNGSEDDSSNGTTSNPSTSVDVPRLPQTGEPVSLFAGALGVITSGLGFVLTRRKK